MPISRDRFFKEGKDPHDAYWLLKRHRKSAFTFREIADSLSMIGGGHILTDLLDFLLLLRELESSLSNGSIEARIVGNEIFYAFKA